MAEIDPYMELGLNRDATPVQIRAAFRKAVRQRHPDTAPGTTSGAGVRDAIDAYRVLSDPEAKATYDAARRRRSANPWSQRAGPGHRSQPVSRRCPTCRGLGIVRAAITCPACRGAAEITDLSGRRARLLRCRACGGRGRVAATGRCPSCGGSGSIDSAGTTSGV